MSKGNNQDKTENFSAPLNPTELYKLFFEESTDCMVAADPDRQIILVNRRGTEVTGYSREELMGMTITDLVSQEDPVMKRTGMGNLQAGRNVTKDCTILRKDGVLLPAEMTTQKQQNGNMLIILRDITERVQTELASQQLLSIIEFLPDATFVIDKEKRIIAWNRACELMTGVKKEAVIGQGDFAYSEAFYGERQPILIDLLDLPSHEVESIYKYVKYAGDSIYAETFIPHLNGGKDVHLWGVAAPMFDRYGHRCGAVESIRDITEQKHIEQELREGELRYRTLFETAGDAIMLMRDNRFIDCNARTLTIFGCIREQFIGANPYEFSPHLQPDGRSSEEKAIEKITMAITKEPQFFEWEHSRYDGTTFPAEVTLNCLKLNGEILLLAIVRDITGRKEAEKALQESEIRYRTILQTAMDEIWLADLNGNLLEVNEAYCRMSGYRKEELLGMNITDLKGHGTAKDTPGYIQRIIKDGEARFETIHRRKDGSTFAVEVSAQHNRSSEQDYLVAILRDITDRKKAEEELRESEARHRTILQTALDGVIRADLNGNLLEVNESYCRMSGYSEKELLGMNASDISLSKTPFSKSERIEKLLKHGGNQYETIHRRKDGSTFSVEVSAQYNSEENYVVVFMRDITERKLAEEELNTYRHHLEEMIIERTAELGKAKEAAEAANEAKSIFLANMSHELRTPMNAIIGFSELLESLTTDPKQKKYLTRIQSSGNTLLSLINDVLDLSKIEAGKMTLKYVPVSIKRLFKDTMHMFSHRLAEKGLDYTIDIADDVPDSILLDEIRLRQVILNLIGNAIKFTSEGGISVIVRAEYPEGNYRSSLDIIFSVEDTGIGIPHEQLETIFEPFEQEKGRTSGQYGGTGLGLAISKNLISAMGGNISLESQIGKGSKFTIVLKSVEICATVPKSEEKIFAYETVSFKKARILIVDDIDYNRDLIRGYLSEYNFEIIEAENGKEAIKKIRKYMPDLILLDMKMPIMDGYTTAPILKSDKHMRHIPVIAVTASVLTDEEKHVRKICDGYLRKPLHRADLIETIMKYLPHSIQEGKKESILKGIKNQNQLEEKVNALPPQIVEEMCNAADRADIITLQKLIEEFTINDQSFADVMIDYIENYDYDGLKKFLKNKEISHE